MSDFVDFNLAKKLKEKGYPQKNCFQCYFVGDDKVRGCSVGDVIHRSHKGEKHLIAAPTISQVLKRLREEKNLSVEPYSCACGWRVTICKTGNVLDGYVSGGTCVKNEVKGYNDGGAFNLYEEAAIAGIEYVLDNLI